MRRRRIPLTPLHHQAGSGRTTLGSGLYEGTSMVTTLCNRVAHATCPMTFHKETLISWLFAPDAVQKLRAAKGLVQPASARSGYEVSRGITLSIDFANASLVTPTNSAWSPQPEAGPFIDAVTQMKSTYESWMKVLHVMNWLDANATPGAIRHYWPTMLSLVPQCEALKEASTFRYVEPAGISALLPLLRETASTVASALLLPKLDLEADGDNMLVTFQGYPLHGHGDMTIQTPAHAFKLVHAKAP